MGSRRGAFIINLFDPIKQTRRGESFKKYSAFICFNVLFLIYNQARMVSKENSVNLVNVCKRLRNLKIKFPVDL